MVAEHAILQSKDTPEMIMQLLQENHMFSYHFKKLEGCKFAEMILIQ
jgi:hypothetical protein